MALQWKPARERRNWLLHLPKHSTIWIRYALHQTDHQQQAILHRFPKKSFFKDQKIETVFCALSGISLSWKTLVFDRFTSQERTNVHRTAFFLHTPDFALSKVTALKVVWGKDISRRSKEPGSELLSRFSAWAPFCKCGCVARTGNESITSVSNKMIVIYIWKIDGKGYICLEKQDFFDNDLCRFRVIFHLYWWSNLEVFVDVWLSLVKSMGEFSIVYKKKNECSAMA